MAMSTTPNVNKTTLWWTVERGPGGKLEDSFWLHGAKHKFHIVAPTAPDGSTPVYAITYDIDNQWTNNAERAARFAKDEYELFRMAAQAKLSSGLDPDTCLLDQLMDGLLILPEKWDWAPDADHPDGIACVQGVASAEMRDLAAHMIALRGTWEARTRTMKLVNVRNIPLFDTTNKIKPVEKTVSIDWAPAFTAGRKVVIEQLKARADVVAKPPSNPESGLKLNALLADAMFAADTTGLQVLKNYELLNLGGMDGQPFRAKSSKATMDGNRSKEIQVAYNHMRFLLYMEWRAFRELI